MDLAGLLPTTDDCWRTGPRRICLDPDPADGLGERQSPYLGIPAFALVAGAVSLEPLVASALPRWILALGDASYSIYLSHGFVVPALMLAMGRMVSPGLGAEALTVVLCISVSSIAGWILFIGIERPMLRALKGDTKTNTNR
jgi:exopolysaccharide production protein ExoZ